MSIELLIGSIFTKKIRGAMSAITVDLTGKRAAVTGAASGIGKAVAESLAAAGAKVTVIDMNETATKEVADQINGIPLVLDYQIVQKSN